MNFYQTFFVSGNALLFFCLFSFLISFYLFSKEQEQKKAAALSTGYPQAVENLCGEDHKNTFRHAREKGSKCQWSMLDLPV